MLDGLAAPIDANRRPEFVTAVTAKLEAANPAAVGPGALHRTARTVLRDFWDPPPDLRQGRLGHEDLEANVRPLCSRATLKLPEQQDAFRVLSAFERLQTSCREDRNRLE
jgi:hypothetical protein